MKSRAVSAAVKAALSLALAALAAHAPLASAQPAAATASRSAKELAKELSNPVAALISISTPLRQGRCTGRNIDAVPTPCAALPGGVRRFALEGERQRRHDRTSIGASLHEPVD